MVCIPCFIIPVLLYIWHKFFQPIMLRYWNPWEKKDEQGRVIQEAPKEPIVDCKDGVCKFSFGRKTQQDAAASEAKCPGQVQKPAEDASSTSIGTKEVSVDSKKDN